VVWRSGFGRRAAGLFPMPTARPGQPC
jgi:hypothetical protein